MSANTCDRTGRIDAVSWHLLTRFSWRAAVLVFVASTPCVTMAQLQQAWVSRYDSGISGGTNRPVQLAFDHAGNVCLTGSSENSNATLGYVTIKYAPNGVQLWVARYDSTNSADAIPSALAADSSNNIVVTGNAVTVKYDPNGHLLWTAPYPGAALATDLSGNVLITGSISNGDTVKLSSNGTLLWATPLYPHPLGGQAILLDSGGNAYVSGNIVDFDQGAGPGSNDLNTVQLYAADGFIGQANSLVPGNVLNPEDNPAQIAGAAIDRHTNVYLGIGFGPNSLYLAQKNNFSGTTADNGFWQTTLDLTVTTKGNGLVLDAATNVIVIGQSAHGSTNLCYATVKLSPRGSPLWTNYYPHSTPGPSAPAAIALDAANNCYVTGSSPGANGADDIVTIKYTPSGDQTWLQRYVSLGPGDAAAAALAVDNFGDLYMTGSETLSGGRIGIVTVKYAPFTVQRQADGTTLLQVEGSPGESFDFQGSADLMTWLHLGRSVAATNGVAQFLDTGSSNIPARFYYTNPQ